VKAWLVSKGGASGAKIATKGWGKSKPVVPNTRPDGSDDPDGRKKNRRVEITVKTR
jgi:outer membrane protein OmpA-like peptidoglycan-associated protein